MCSINFLNMLIMINLLLFGPPGAGKGTQAEFIIEKYGLTQLSTGDAIRAEIARGSELGCKAKDLTSRGELLSDDMVLGIIHDYLSRQKDSKGTIFDGFPRTQEQADALDEMLEKENRTVDVLISLEVEEDELVRRMKERGKISGRADDLCDEAIHNRIRVYEQKTKIVKEHYRAQGKCFEIDGMQSIEAVTAKINEIIDAHL